MKQTYKILILKDPTINKSDLDQITKEVGELYERNCNIPVTWHYEDMDYSNYPVEMYWGGYEGIRQSWLREKCTEVYKRWAEEVDCVVFAVSSNNWNLKGVWGWNMSAQYSGYGVQQVRIAQVKTHTKERNINNSVGTLYHELHHDVDTFVFNYTGYVVEQLVRPVVNNWDMDITHGGSQNWEYIRHKENQASLVWVAPQLKEAINKRRAIYTQKVTLMEKIIQLAEKVVVLQRQLISRQRGDVPILADNKCGHVI